MAKRITSGTLPSSKSLKNVGRWKRAWCVSCIVEKYTRIRSSQTSRGGIPESGEVNTLSSTGFGPEADAGVGVAGFGDVAGFVGDDLDQPTRQNSRLNEHSNDRDSQ